MFYFAVRTVGDPTLEQLQKLIEDYANDWSDDDWWRYWLDLLDSGEYNYFAIANYVGTTPLALRLMALGCAVGLWHLYEPRRLYPDLSESTLQLMASTGFITISTSEINMPHTPHNLNYQHGQSHAVPSKPPQELHAVRGPVEFSLPDSDDDRDINEIIAELYCDLGGGG